MASEYIISNVALKQLEELEIQQQEQWDLLLKSQLHLGNNVPIAPPYEPHVTEENKSTEKLNSTSKKEKIISESESNILDPTRIDLKACINRFIKSNKDSPINDCTFVIGPEKQPINSISLLWAIRSPVFHKLLYNNN